MPLRAFLLFGPDGDAVQVGNPTVPGFNALAGIFAFRTLVSSPGFTGGMGWVSMPLRAFLLFGR